MTVRDIFNFLNEKYPVDTACGFDNVGILIGDPDAFVSKAIVALDCTTDAIKTARNNGCELIITHHPVIFSPLKHVLKGSIAYEVLKNGISVISMHTNLDIGEGGVNDNLVKILSPISVETVLTYDGYAIKKCEIEPISADDLAEKVKSTLGGAVKYTDCKKPITSILVCGGSGGNYVEETAKFGADALLTADVKHNHFLDADRLGVALFDAGHFDTEDVVIEPLKELLQSKFNEIEFITNHTKVIKNR